MPKKFLLSLVLVVVLSLPIFSQVSRVSAQEAPITSSITNPITFFNLTGTITYKRLGFFFRNVTNRILPADNVKVTVTGFFDKSQRFQTTTDANGNYSINLPTGLYTIKTNGGRTNFFSPPLRVMRVKTNATSTANFQGFLFR